MRNMASVIAAAVAISVGTAPLHATSTTRSFEARADDRRAIQALLTAYTQAVSTKNQAAFETLLLNKTISFAYVPSAGADVAKQSVQGYEAFRKAVFEGPAFVQSFERVHIRQDGNLADVTLIFVNVDAKGSSWGWKTMQLLKVDRRWKIASEFFTVH